MIEAGVILKGQTKIGQDCYITAHSEIVDSVIEDGVTIKHSVVEESIVRTQVQMSVHLPIYVQKQISV